MIACRQFEEQACKTTDQTHQNVLAFLDMWITGKMLGVDQGMEKDNETTHLSARGGTKIQTLKSKSMILLKTGIKTLINFTNILKEVANVTENTGI